MNFVKTPVKGMPEQTPQDMEIREYALRKIKDTYSKFGFMQISTPYIEHIQNLTGKQGGENEQLIFKILKRGEKLQNANGLEDMCDSGLRYDLTLPLARFYANNCESLPMPFKALQIGDVFRADRPQKGRFRQFTQCDIDILGDASCLAEIELICATTNMLCELGINQLKVRINDRNILKAMALCCDFPQDQLDTIFIILDKMDKIGLDGVKQSLVQLGIEQSNVQKYCAFFENLENSQNLEQYLNQFGDFLPKDIANNLETIIQTTSQIVDKNCKIVFDPTLVRGMSYYTGTIFEIELENYNLSVCGGGRYDKMIGKFCNKDVPACGFSIGFERIISVIKENNLLPIEQKEKIAILIAKDCDENKIKEAINQATALRAEGKVVMISPKNNNSKFQKETLSNYGYTKFIEIFNN